MPGGRGKIRHEDGKAFSKENQPENRGRKKKLPALDVLLAEVLGSEDESGEKSEAKAILAAMIKEAKRGNVQAGVAVLNRAYGMPKQSVDHSGNIGITNGGEIDPKDFELIRRIAEKQ